MLIKICLTPLSFSIVDIEELTTAEKPIHFGIFKGA